VAWRCFECWILNFELKRGWETRDEEWDGEAMRKVLGDDLELYYEYPYPFINRKKFDKRHIVTVGIGGNIGNVKRRFKKLFLYLQKNRSVDIIKTSPILKNPPFGFVQQNDFLNAVMVLRTDMYPKEFLKFALHTEKIFARKRSFKNAPRTLDIDIIFFDKMAVNKKDLQIPHPKWNQRISVTIPLSLI